MNVENAGILPLYEFVHEVSDRRNDVICMSIFIFRIQVLYLMYEFVH
jgi:hypothetical protein